MSAAGTAAGSTFELPAVIVASPPKTSLRVKRRRISAPAALKLLWPDEYSGNGGVGKYEGWYGSHSPPSISPWPRYGPAQAMIVRPRKRWRTAVIGRTDAYEHLLSQAQIPASKTALVRAKNNLTSRSTPCSSGPWRSRRATNWANRFQCPGGSSERGPSAQYSVITFSLSVSPALTSTRSAACVS